jgi:hypothetical protein
VEGKFPFINTRGPSRLNKDRKLHAYPAPSLSLADRFIACESGNIDLTAPRFTSYGVHVSPKIEGSLSVTRAKPTNRGVTSGPEPRPMSLLS